jgi:hypothetical protein
MYNHDMSRTKILDRFLDPVGSLLTPEVARRLVRFRADAKTQKYLDQLADKNQEGVLSDAEREEYDTLISAIDFVTVLQTKARSLLKRHVKR